MIIFVFQVQVYFCNRICHIDLLLCVCDRVFQFGFVARFRCICYVCACVRAGIYYAWNSSFIHRKNTVYFDELKEMAIHN